MTEDGQRKIAMGGIRPSELSHYGDSRLKREFRRLAVPLRNHILAGARGNTLSRGRATQLGMSTHEFSFWIRVVQRLIREEGRMI